MYPLEALPDEAQSKIRRPAQPKPTQPAPADSASTQKKPKHKKRLFLGLGPGQRARVEAKAEAVCLWRHYKQRVSREISIGDARKAFCTLWKAGHAGAEERAHKALPSFAVSSLYNWNKALEKGGLNALVDQRGQAQAGRGILDTDNTDAPRGSRYAGCPPTCRRDPPRARAGGAISLLSAPPPVRPHHPELDEIMEGGEQGIVGIPMRSGRCERLLRCLRRTGRRGCGFAECALGGRATTADVLLSDGQRHTILGIIDVWSRRVLLHVTRTSSSTAVCTALRRTILAWGVPSAVRCDNGKEFISRHTRTALTDLGIAQEIAPPFQPERKPFIKRALGTFSHDLLELLPGFCGHDVSDRQAIRSRHSFSARFGRGENTEGRLTPKAFQEFCDKWCALYVSRPHQGLGGLTPAFRASNWIGLVGMIEDERALDILLSEPAQGGVRTVHKKGISVGGLWHVAADLGACIGQRVRIRLDEGDAGKIFVFSTDGTFLCEAVSPECTGVSRRQLAQATRKVQVKMLRKAKKAITFATRVTAPHGIAREILAGVEPEASDETPCRLTPAVTPALKEAVRAAHSDEVPEMSPPSKEQGEVVDALALMRKRLHAKEQRAIQKQKELEDFMKEDGARVRDLRKAREEEQRKEREEGLRRLAKERKKVGDPWPAPRFEGIVV